MGWRGPITNLIYPASPLLLHPPANSRGLASLQPLANRPARWTFTFKPAGFMVKNYRPQEPLAAAEDRLYISSSGLSKRPLEDTPCSFLLLGWDLDVAQQDPTRGTLCVTSALGSGAVLQLLLPKPGVLKCFQWRLKGYKSFNARQGLVIPLCLGSLLSIAACLGWPGACSERHSM